MSPDIFRRLNFGEKRRGAVIQMRRGGCWRSRWCWRGSPARRRRRAAAWTGRPCATGSIAAMLRGWPVALLNILSTPKQSFRLKTKFSSHLRCAGVLGKRQPYAEIGGLPAGQTAGSRWWGGLRRRTSPTFWSSRSPSRVPGEPAISPLWAWTTVGPTASQCGCPCRFGARSGDGFHPRPVQGGPRIRLAQSAGAQAPRRSSREISGSPGVHPLSGRPAGELRLAVQHATSGDVREEGSQFSRAGCCLADLSTGAMRDISRIRRRWTQTTLVISRASLPATALRLGLLGTGDQADSRVNRAFSSVTCFNSRTAPTAALRSGSSIGRRSARRCRPAGLGRPPADPDPSASAPTRSARPRTASPSCPISSSITGKSAKNQHQIRTTFT